MVFRVDMLSPGMSCRPFVAVENAFHFHREDKAGERQRDAIAEPDRRRFPEHAVDDPKARAGLQHEQRDQAEIVRAAGAPGLHDLRQERERRQTAGHKAKIFYVVHGDHLIRSPARATSASDRHDKGSVWAAAVRSNRTCTIMDDSVARRSRRKAGRTGCAVEATLSVIGGVWKPGPVFHLLHGKLR